MNICLQILIHGYSTVSCYYISQYVTLVRKYNKKTMHGNIPEDGYLFFNFIYTFVDIVYQILRLH
jgi:hypothetical protein